MMNDLFKLKIVTDAVGGLAGLLHDLKHALHALFLLVSGMSHKLISN